MSTCTIDTRIAELENKVRTKVEVLLNKGEKIRLDNLRGGLGRSPYFRALLDEADRPNGSAPPPARESRGCRGQGKPASRANAALSMRRRF